MGTALTMLAAVGRAALRAPSASPAALRACSSITVPHARATDLSVTHGGDPHSVYKLPDVGSVCPVFKSDAEARIALIAPIKCKTSTARCDGGGGPLGHPVEYIQLNTKRAEPQTCKYCGLRFVYDPSH